MIPTQYQYPVFEANQVLTDRHLNQVFDYLDEQERLTRTNLIGIGIVCGLEIALDQSGPTIIRLSRGCGITSQGYLIIEGQDVVLNSYKAGYKVPSLLPYPAFFDSNDVQYPLWELFTSSEPNTTLLASPSGFLDDKVVLLFLELKEDDLRNCSPNNCDDKGSAVVGTLRRLLIRSADLDEIIANANSLNTGMSASELDNLLSARLNLPDIRLPRFNVPNTNPVTSQDIYNAYLHVFRSNSLVTTTAQALAAAYTAFRPIVAADYPADPFTGFIQKFGFLQATPGTKDQVLFLQYYYDLFDDLLKAYDEFRWKGAALMCACCPDERLFPRHLMLGPLFPGHFSTPGLYRHHFLASGALDRCEDHTRDLLTMFKRLVEMANRFTNLPALPATNASGAVDEQIRITPSKLADVPVSEKAIPYYYGFGGQPPMHQLWNATKNNRRRANQNLGYYADTYIPAAPAFVTQPLRYDLEPFNFLRIEGHLKKNFKTVLKTIVALKTRFRLPIEIIALRTGAFDEKMEVDLKREDCRFRDLDTLFDALRDELLCSIRKAVASLADKKIDRPVALPEAVVVRRTTAKISFSSLVPEYTLKPDTFGAFIAERIKDNNFAGLHDFAEKPLVNAVATTAGLLLQMAELLTSDLFDMDWDRFDLLYDRLKKSNADFSKVAAADETVGDVSWKELQTQLMSVIFACRLEAFKSIKEEYIRRIRELKQKQFLSFFAQHNPGLQHKAGVPVGGTFILVYHEDPKPVRPPRPVGPFTDLVATPELLDNRFTTEQPVTRTGRFAGNVTEIDDALNRVRAKKDLILDPDIQSLFASLTGEIPALEFLPTLGLLDDATASVINETVNSLADGTVIADFYLPYICCSDCAPVQYVLPAEPFSFEILKACTTSKREAEITIKPLGGVSPFTVQLNGEAFKPLVGAIVAGVGQHTITLQDSTGAQSASQTIVIPEPLSMTNERIVENAVNGTFKVAFTIAGGTPPYTTNFGNIQNNVFESNEIAKAGKQLITITDNAGCAFQKEYGPIAAGPCDLPCNGIAARCGYRFWIPVPERQFDKPYKSYTGKVRDFRITLPDGSQADLSAEVEAIIQSDADALNNDFTGVVQRWMNKINDLVATRSGSQDTMILSYSDRPRETFGTLEIEYFQCHRFHIHIEAHIIRPNNPEVITTEYLPNRTTVTIQGQEPLIIPAFNCITINKCSANREIEIGCRELELKLEIHETLQRTKLKVGIKVLAGADPETLVWEVQDATPPFSNEREPVFAFAREAGGFKTIRVKAFTASGCMVSMEKVIELRR